MSFAAAIENALREGCWVWQADLKVVGESNGKHFAYYPRGYYGGLRGE